jgi:hypothetical protein
VRSETSLCTWGAMALYNGINVITRPRIPHHDEAVGPGFTLIDTRGGRRRDGPLKGAGGLRP